MKTLSKVKSIKNRLNNMYTKAFSALLIVMCTPVFALADGTDNLTTWLQKIMGIFGSIKTFGWAVAGLVGIIGFVYGMSMVAIITMKTDYRGKMSAGKAVIIAVVGIIVGSAGTYFSMIANTTGSADAQANANSNGYTGFDN